MGSGEVFRQSRVNKGKAVFADLSTSLLLDKNFWKLRVILLMVQKRRKKVKSLSCV